MHVTVLMGVYNMSTSVRRAIESILGQSYADLDLLIVDDASTDGTSELLRSMSRRDSRITIVRNDRNYGLAFSLNRGWRLARGGLIARMDADDVSLPERLCRQAEFMQTHPEVAVLGTGAKLVDEAGQLVGSTLRPTEHEALVSKIYKECPFIHPTVMLRREFLEATGGYDNALRGSEDYDLWLRGYRRFRYANLPETLICYRIRRSPSWHAVLYGMSVLTRGGMRDRRCATGLWYAFRFGFAGTLSRLRLYKSHA